MNESHNRIKQLAEQFKFQEAAYLSSGYQESQVRQDFIDKLFAALGWDVTHEVQKNPYEQEVKIENKVNTSGSQRRADYAFFISPNFRDVKFFVEAKKPSRNLANPNDYYQTIRYGWNSKTPIAVLTDFEEFHILDCRFKPDIKTALDRKIEVFHYLDFEDEEKFKRIFYLFNRDEVANGSIEKFAVALPKPRAKVAKLGMYKAEYKPVDEAFLESLDGYREQLARAFKNKNQDLEGEELTEAVQRTIDRLVFIRFLEDKSIEEPAIVAIKDKPAVWEAFASLCKRLEPKYNGLVFKPHRIIDSADFIPPDSKMFAEICSELADPTSPYDFDKIPISILGSIYERFLGKVVSTTEKRAKVIEKPEVRKAGGVYYTPEYIVRYIVTETVGKLIEGKTPQEISQMSFADIACGSGSFLIEVYSQLLDYHTKYYNEHPEKVKKGDVETREGKIVLSLKKRQEILTNNIYGVDIDFQATEVTQLSLYLKLLEDVTMNDAFQYSLLKEKILPDLRNNIVCGNSLIGTDILEGKLFDSEEERKLNPMNFDDVFPDIMKRGGFDAVVGNPPYVNNKELPEDQKKYFSSKYKTAVDQFDLYTLFIENGLNLLTEDGYFSYIIPDAIIDRSSATSLRKFIFEYSKIISLLQINKVFEEAKVGSIILVLQKKKNAKEKFNYFKCANPKEFFSNKIQTKAITQSNLQNFRNYSYLFVDDSEWAVIQKIFNDKISLESISFTGRGEELGKSSNLAKNVKGKNNIGLLYGEDIQRYHLEEPERFISKNDIRKQERLYDVKIVVRQVGEEINASFDDKKYVTIQSVYTIIPNDEYDHKYILGILNSKMIDFIYRKLYKSKELFPRILLESLKELPIPQINFQNKTDKAAHDKIVQLVEQMLTAKEKLSKAKLDAEVNKLEMQIASLARQIDTAVYELYGLTEQEIKIVEGKV